MEVHLPADVPSRRRYALLDGADAVIVVVDADTDCPRELATNLAARVVNLNLSAPVTIVCPKSEFEAWIIASLSEELGDEIRNRLCIENSVVGPDNPENVRNAKRWLNDRMPRDRTYKPTQDQEKLTYYISLDLVHDRSRSFRRLCHAMEELVEALDENVSGVTPALDDSSS